MSRYRRLARYPLRQWRSLLLIVVATLGFSVTAALQPLPMKLLVDDALGGGTPPGWVRTVIGWAAEPTPGAVLVAAAVASLLLLLLNSALTVAVSWGWTAAGQRMVYDLASDLFAKLQRLSLRFHARRDVGDSLSRLAGDTYAVYSLTSALMVSPLRQVLTLGAVGYTAWILDPQLTLIALAAAPALAVSARAFGHRLQRRATREREARARVASFVQQTLRAMPVVHAFQGEGRNRRRFRELADDMVGATQSAVAGHAAFTQVNAVVTAVGTALVVFVGIERVLDGSLSVGTLLVFVAYLRTLEQSVRELLDTYAEFRAAQASVDRVFEVLEARDEITDRDGAWELTARPVGHVRLERVTFGYEPGRPVVQDVTLDARPGEVVALVGRSGAGKSTLLSLVSRLFDPWSGRVTLDGDDLRALRLDSVREYVAVVLQEPFLLPLSVAENIAYGRPGATAEEIVTAATAAQADEFIRRLPSSYDTVIGEMGATLSGGERQRIAIARALLKDAPVLVLDEPTSALDTATEAKLLGALQRLMAGRTTFVIAHRLSTIRRADRIIVLDDGRVVESGSHEELLRARGSYQRLYEMQVGLGAGITP
jgi:ATP-binding cassette, subfamily B, bacterial